MHVVTGLVQPLFDGPVDIVGDVHGEFRALTRLMQLLGYRPDGTHDERRLFLGDLVDRGHDSPAVIDLVIDLVARGLAQCVLGNHELNILSGRYGHGNGWLLDPPEGTPAETYDSRPADVRRRPDYLRFMEGQPLALENDALRVVHACWHEPSIDTLRVAASATDLAARHRGYDESVISRLAADDILQAALAAERLVFDPLAQGDVTQAAVAPAHAALELARLHGNPIRVLTEGSARPTTTTYFGAGRWRTTERIPWWNTYRDPQPVVIGHFWRGVSTTPGDRYGGFGQDVLAGVAPHDWMGLRHNVYCVDYSVGKRHLARSTRRANDGKLAALRYPEWEVVHDDGAIVAIGPPGVARAE